MGQMLILALCTADCEMLTSRDIRCATSCTISGMIRELLHASLVPKRHSSHPLQ